MKRGQSLTSDPERAAERRRRREERRASEPERPEDVVREIRALAKTGRRSKPSQRGRGNDPAPNVDIARAYWHRTVTAGGCVVCRDTPPTHRERADYGPDFAVVEAHHVIPRRTLKRLGLWSRRYDVQNGIGLCRRHHSLHEQAVRRVPRRLLPQAAWDFAREIDQVGMLEDDRVYPLAA